MDRLVSAYRDKFLNEDEPCYRRKIGRPIKLELRGEVDKWWVEDLRMDEFVHYLLKEQPATYDRHWMSMYNLCHPCSFKYDFIAKVETLDRDSLDLFYIMNMNSSSLPFLNTHGGRTFSNKYMTYFRNITTDQYHKLTEIYERDFTLFGYDIESHDTLF